MSLRAEVGARRARAGLRGRWERLRERMLRIVTSAGGAALAWWLARDGLGHPQPFFAPVTVLVTLGLSYGQRLRRVTELVVGVAVGVLVGDAFVYLVGTGPWQIALVATVAMSIATLLGAGPLLTIQAGVQSIIVTTLVAQPDQAFSRWLDAVVGGVVAIVLATTAPAAAVERPRQALVDLVREVDAILRASVRAVRQADAGAAERALSRARRTEGLIASLREDSGAALEVAAISPWHARRRADVQLVSEAIDPLDRAVRNLRVLVRRCGVAVRAGEEVPTAYLAAADRLAEVVGLLAEELDEGRTGILVREALVGVLRRTAARDPEADLSAELVRAQLRSMVLDLLMVTGLSEPDAADLGGSVA